MVWEGRSREAPPYPDPWQSETSTDVRYTAAFGGNADNQPVIAGQSRFMNTRPSEHEPVGGPGMSQVSEYSFEKMARPLTDCRKEIGKGAACTAARTHFGNKAMIYKSPGDNFSSSHACKRSACLASHSTGTASLPHSAYGPHIQPSSQMCRIGRIDVLFEPLSPSGLSKRPGAPASIRSGLLLSKSTSGQR